MEISDLAALAPWRQEGVVPAAVHAAVIDSFLAAHRRAPLRLHAPPPAGRMHGCRAPLHTWPELFVQLAGHRGFAFPGGGAEVAPGEICLVPRGVPHAESLVERGHGHAFLVVMAHAGRPSLHLTARWPRGEMRNVAADVYADREGAPIERLLDELALLAADGDPRAVAAGVELALLHLRRCIAGPSALAGGHRPLVNRCLQLLAVRLHESDLAVAGLAADLACTPDHLGRCFREDLGETLVGHIARQRIAVARDLLAAGHRDIGNVAAACGFADPAYFSKVFRRQSGVSPRAWLRRRPTAGP
jgi:AraC-like DNA-binding protein